MMTAMLMQLAPMAVMSPSPNTSAWITSAMDTAIAAAHGPSRMAMSVAPTAWPVEPPMTGTLNIMITNEKAAASAMSGTCLALSAFLTLAPATHQMGTMAASSATYVCGPRYPSGMCTVVG